MQELVASNHTFPIMAKSRLFRHKKNGHFLHELFELAKNGKLLFPYGIAQSMERLRNANEFAQFWEFKGTLTGKISITKQQYDEAKLIYSKFSCSSMLDFLLLYNWLDCLHLGGS